jgi:hypothetical protein
VSKFKGSVWSTDGEGMDYTNWSKEDLIKLRVMQREEGAGPEETDAVEVEIRRRSRRRQLLLSLLLCVLPFRFPPS